MKGEHVSENEKMNLHKTLISSLRLLKKDVRSWVNIEKQLGMTIELRNTYQYHFEERRQHLMPYTITYINLQTQSRHIQDVSSGGFNPSTYPHRRSPAENPAAHSHLKLADNSSQWHLSGHWRRQSREGKDPAEISQIHVVYIFIHM